MKMLVFYPLSLAFSVLALLHYSEGCGKCGSYCRPPGGPSGWGPRGDSPFHLKFGKLGDFRILIYFNICPSYLVEDGKFPIDGNDGAEQMPYYGEEDYQVGEFFPTGNMTDVEDSYRGKGENMDSYRGNEENMVFHLITSGLLVYFN